MKIERKRLVLLSLLVFGSITAFAQKISQNVMQKILRKQNSWKVKLVKNMKELYHLLLILEYLLNLTILLKV